MTPVDVLVSLALQGSSGPLHPNRSAADGHYRFQMGASGPTIPGHCKENGGKSHFVHLPSSSCDSDVRMLRVLKLKCIEYQVGEETIGRPPAAPSPKFTKLQLM